jgi:hypothetical protein
MPFKKNAFWKNHVSNVCLLSINISLQGICVREKEKEEAK